MKVRQLCGWLGEGRVASRMIALFLGLLIPISVQAQHTHLNVGAVGKNQNDQLIFANGNEFALDSGYVKTLDYTNSGKFAGFYQQNITLTALPATAAHAGPDPAACAFGSVIRFRLACLQAPPGGEFGFWDTNATAAPSISLAAGQSSTNLWLLTESDGSPGTDPYGHIHGRRFTATRSGFYVIGFTAVDTSTNGAGGGPIHTPSAELAVWFQAGPNIWSVEPDYEEGHVHIRFGAAAGYSWQVEESTELGANAVWQTAGTPIMGADVMVSLTHDTPPGPARFYRIVGTPVLP